jgi:chemotaxis protein MotA
MDVSILAGFAAGLAVLALAMLLGHVPPEILLHPEALLIVFAGTLTATVAGAGRDMTLRALRALFFRGGAENRLSPRQAVSQAMDVAVFVRDEGILALQPVVDSVDLPFFRKGLFLLLDNRPVKFIRDSLSTDMEIRHRQALDEARVFEIAGGYAPTMGIIGAVIGLVYVLQGMSAPGLTSPMGRDIAGAFIATLYGVAFANLFLLPAAARLRRRAREEWQIRALLLEAVLGIYAGEHPLLLEERLNAFGAADDTRIPERSIQTQAESIRLPRLNVPNTDDEVFSPDVDRLPAHAVMSDDFLRTAGRAMAGAGSLGAL